MVLFAQGDDLGASGRLFGLGSRSRTREDKKGGIRVTNEAVAEYPEGAGRIAEGACDLMRSALLDVESAQGFVLPMPGIARLEKEGSRICYDNWCSDLHNGTVLHTTDSVNVESPPHGRWC